MINEATRDRLGGLHSADCLLRSFDFADDRAAPARRRLGRGRRAARRRGRARWRRPAPSCSCCAPTRCTSSPTRSTSDRDPVPAHRRHHRRGRSRARTDTVGLLATAYTMEQDFYVGRLRDRTGSTCSCPTSRPPDRPRRDLRGAVRRRRRRRLARRIPADHRRPRRPRRRGHPARLHRDRPARRARRTRPVPVFDTTRLHAQRAVDLALTGDELDDNDVVDGESPLRIRRLARGGGLRSTPRGGRGSGLAASRASGLVVVVVHPLKPVAMSAPPRA